jgi:hypothetical protein
MTAAEVSLPKVSKAKKVASPSVDTATASAPEVQTREHLTYGEAIKLVAGVLRNNQDSALLCEAVRDLIAGTGLDVSYEQEEAEV